MGYKTETREVFMRDEWPIISQIIDMAAATVPRQNVVDGLGREEVDNLVRKLVAVAETLKRIVDDDQAEIGSLKAINKAREH